MGVTLDLYHKCSKKQFIWNFRIQDPNYVKRMKNFSRYKHVEKEFMLEYSTPLHHQSRIQFLITVTISLTIHVEGLPMLVKIMGPNNVYRYAHHKVCATFSQQHQFIYCYLRMRYDIKLRLSRCFNLTHQKVSSLTKLAALLQSLLLKLRYCTTLTTLL